MCTGQNEGAWSAGSNVRMDLRVGYLIGAQAHIGQTVSMALAGRHGSPQFATLVSAHSSLLRVSVKIASLVSDVAKVKHFITHF